MNTPEAGQSSEIKALVDKVGYKETTKEEKADLEAALNAFYKLTDQEKFDFLCKLETKKR